MIRQALFVFVTAAVLAGAGCTRDEVPRATPPRDAAVAAPDAAPGVDSLIPVLVTLPEEPEPEVEAWGRELAAAIAAGHGGLRIVEAPEAALVEVRVDVVETEAEVSPEPPGEGQIVVMRGAIVVGESSRAFSLAYRGEARPQAEALARNLRGFATEGAAARPVAPPPEGTGPTTGEPD